MERKYESMMILKPDLADQEKEEIFSKMIKRVENLKGKILDSKVWAKERNFYYFLKSKGADKKKYFKGCYWLVNFTLDIESLADFKETVRLEERILRSIIINKEGQKEVKFTKESDMVGSLRSKFGFGRTRET